jgi:hypothetical protein
MEASAVANRANDLGKPQRKRVTLFIEQPHFPAVCVRQLSQVRLPRRNTARKAVQTEYDIDAIALLGLAIPWQQRRNQT